MTKISRSVFMMKRVFPIFWFGFLFCFAASALGLWSNGAPLPGGLTFLATPILMAVGGYVLMKHLIWGLVDEVYDGGDYLIVRNRGDEARIDLADVMNVSVSTYMNPPRITLRFVQPSRFGTEISFSPVHPFTLNPFAKNQVAEDLIVRVHQARTGRARY